MAAEVVTLGAVLLVALLVGAPLAGMHIASGHLAAAVVTAVLLAVGFGAVAMAVGAATGRRAVATGAAAALALAAYLVDSLGALVPWLHDLGPITPFHHYAAPEPLRAGVSLPAPVGAPGALRRRHGGRAGRGGAPRHRDLIVRGRRRARPASARSARTSSSDTAPKSRYQRPTLRNRRGTTAHTQSPASAASIATACSDPTGAATTTRAAPRSRADATAARSAEPGGQAVVDDDHRGAAQVRGRGVAAEGADPRLHLRAARRDEPLELGGRHADARGGPAVHQGHAALGDRADRELRLDGCADLAHHRDVERRPRARATSAATGTPPRGTPSTTAPSPARSPSSAARRRPASAPIAERHARSSPRGAVRATRSAGPCRPRFPRDGAAVPSGCTATTTEVHR